MLKFFQSRTALAGAASLAVVALMAVSVGTVRAVEAQDQQAIEEAKQNAEKLQLAMELERRALMESKLHLAEEIQSKLQIAKEALHEARQQSDRGRLRMVQELRQRAPRVEFRRLGSNYGRSTADRVLAMSEELGVTEQQGAQIRDVRRNLRRAAIERDAQIDVLDLDLDEMLEDRHTANLDAVEELMQRRASLRVQGQVADMRASQEVWNLLDADQQAKLEENRHNVYMMRGDSQSLFFDGGGPDFAFRGGDYDFGEMEFGKLFNGLHLEGFDALLELKSEDGAPFIWRFEHKSDDKDAQKKDESKEKGKTEGTAVGDSSSGESTRTMN